MLIATVTTDSITGILSTALLEYLKSILHVQCHVISQDWVIWTLGMV